MIRLKVIQINSDIASKTSSNYADLSANEIEKVEEFIAEIGYENIKNIIVSGPNSSYSCYSFFYEDGQPYTPRTEPVAHKKKGIFG